MQKLRLTPTKKVMNNCQHERKLQLIKPLFREQQQRYNIRKRHKRVAHICGVPCDTDGNECAEKYKGDVSKAIQRQKKPEAAAFSAEIAQALFAVKAPTDSRCKRKKYQAYAEHNAPERGIFAEHGRKPFGESRGYKVGGFKSF